MPRTATQDLPVKARKAPVFYKTNCKTCMATRGPANAKLRERIRHAKWERTPGDETLTQIAAEIGVAWKPFHNHTERHMRRDTTELSIERRQNKAIEKIKAETAKALEVSLEHDEITAQTDYESLLTDVIAAGNARIRRGEVQVSVTQAIAAAKIKADIEVRKKTQSVELIKTMYMLSNKKGPVDGGGSTEADAGVAGAGPGRPSGIYREATRNPVTQGSEEIPQTS